MASVNNFKPPVKNNLNKTKLQKKPAVSLTDKQYEEIFDAAINPQKALKLKIPFKVDLPKNEAKSPTEKVLKKPAISLTDKQYEEIFDAVINPSQTGLKLKVPFKADLPGNEAKSPTESAVVKANTFRSEDTSCESDSETESLDSSITAPPKKLTKRQRLEWLQERRGTGMYVKCDDKTCVKWRWLENPDPVDLPPKWFCYMNPDKSLAACSVPECKIPKDIEGDLVHNIYSPGSIVWAKMAGYPWWPAMVDDCPDCEQYYWINKRGHLVPDYYNVVFFDNTEVARHWILVKNLKSYKHNPDFDKKFKLQLIYKKRMRLAKEKANTALHLHIKDRLKFYSFLALWNNEIPEFLTSSSDDDSDVDEADYEKRIKRKIIQRKRAHDNNKFKDLKSNEIGHNSTDCVQDDNSDNSVILKLIARNKSKLSTSPKKDIKLIEKSNSKYEKETIPSQKDISNKEKIKRYSSQTVGKSINIKCTETTENKQSLPQEKGKSKESLNKDSPKTVAESKLKKESSEKCTESETTVDKQSLPQEKDKGKENLNNDPPKTVTENKLKKKSNEKCPETKTTDDKQSLPQEKGKDKENLNRDKSLTADENSSSSEGIQIFRPVDRILDESRPDDRDLAQQAYDMCLSLFTSGKHGEAQFEKMYKKITTGNNNELLSPKTETTKEPDKSSKTTMKNEEEKKEPEKINQTEKLSKTPKIRLIEKSPKQTIVLHSKGQKRNVEDELCKVVKVIKLAQKAQIDANQNTSI